MRKILVWVAVMFSMAGSLYAIITYRQTSPKVAVAPIDPKSQVIEHFELEGFDDDGNASWRLVGESARISAETDVFIERNVVLTMLGGAIIRTDKVFWQNAKTRFVTNQPVRVLHRNIEVDGRGAIGKLNQKSIQINQDVRMRIDPDGTIVTCRGPMRILQAESRVTLYHDVSIHDRRGAMTADRMDAYFDPDTKKIVAITATGNVRIMQEGDVSVANKAIYDTRTGSVRLEGKPEINIRDTSRLSRKGAADLPSVKL